MMKKAESLLEENNKSCLTFQCCHFLEWRITRTTFLAAQRTAAYCSHACLLEILVYVQARVRVYVWSKCSLATKEHKTSLGPTTSQRAASGCTSQINQACLLFLLFPRQLKDLPDAEGLSLAKRKPHKRCKTRPTC